MNAARWCRSRCERAERSDDAGAASTFGVVVVGLLLALGTALATLGAVVVDLRAAQGAADLAALGAAAALGRGQDGCAAASGLAGANGARLVTCTVGSGGREVRLSVEVEGPHWFGLDADPGAEARAGPVSGG